MKVSLTKIVEHVVEEPVEEIIDATSENLEVPDPELNVRSEELSLAYDLSSIIQRVEALDRTEERVKAIGKLKGALELLS